ncbi:MAG TPA: hypothetical protein VMD77_05650 [Candidatus Baltobacteraceae bacterium]|nr:hypothetical protein [Candidatus Baltobacteraceae bacterium]
MPASQDTKTPQAPQEIAKPLTNADVLDMLKAGLSQEIVIAKIKASSCEFDTAPAALKELKAANIPDAVILAMVQAPSEVPAQEGTSVASPIPSLHATAKDEPSGSARVDCNQASPVSIYSAPYSGSESAEVFKLKCGDRITLLNPSDKETWLKIRAEDGQEGYISAVLVSKEQPAESESQKREEIQKANDERDDCTTRAQNEYDAKMNTLSALALTPIQRVYASTKLKQKMDEELRMCRSQYESRLKVIDAE